ncbi:hypothetical protein GB937_002919 [Aspergillus fischeri]|nr:hypothetical protein GB937_002919 [Aspergillus fischeri]
MPQKPVATFTCVINLDEHDDREIKRAVLPRTAERYERSVKIFDRFLELHPAACSPPDIKTYKGFLEFYARNTTGRIEEKPTTETVENFRRDFETALAWLRGFRVPKNMSNTLKEVWIFEPDIVCILIYLKVHHIGFEDQTYSGGSYQVQANNTCVSISGAVNVSTYDLISSNALDLACNSLSEGKTLCLPPTCTTHQLDMPDTCDSLTASLNITFAQLLAWNPIFNSGCSNLATWRGWFLCASAPTTAAPVPNNAQGQSNTKCAEWYLVSSVAPFSTKSAAFSYQSIIKVQSGDYCSSISVKFGISLNDFYFLNPQVDVNCSNLWLNTSYCVQAVGNIATYSGYPVTTPSYTFTKLPSTTAFTPVPIATPPLNPKAPGTWANCTFYENAFNTKIDNYESLNSCHSWSINSGSTVEQLIHWNPSLDPKNCVLDPAYSYCLISGEPQACFNCSMFPSLFNVTVPEVTSMNPWLGTDCDKNLWSVLSSDGYLQLCVQQGQPNTTSSTVPSTTATATATATTSSTVAPPAPTQPGAAANCSKWHTVVSGDGCQAIATQYGISLANFYLWNPGVGSDCSTLWLGYAVCVGV